MDRVEQKVICHCRTGLIYCTQQKPDHLNILQNAYGNMANLPCLANIIKRGDFARQITAHLTFWQILGGDSKCLQLQVLVQTFAEAFRDIARTAIGRSDRKPEDATFFSMNSWEICRGYSYLSGPILVNIFPSGTCQVCSFLFPWFLFPLKERITMRLLCNNFSISDTINAYCWNCF